MHLAILLVGLASICTMTLYANLDDEQYLDLVRRSQCDCHRCMNQNDYYLLPCENTR